MSGSSSLSEVEQIVSRRKFLKGVALAGGLGAASLALPAAMIRPSQAVGTTDVAPASYIVENNAGTITAYHCNTGSVDYSGSSAATVIQQALNGLTPNRTWKEKVVLKGNFTLSDTSSPQELSIPSYTILEIQGSLKLATLPSNITSMHMLYVYNATDVDIIGGVLNGNRTGQGANFAYGDAIVINGSERVVVQSTRMTNTRQWGIYVYEGNRNKFFGVVTDNCGWDGIAVEGANNMAVDNEFYSVTSHDNGLANDAYAPGNKNGLYLEGHPGGGPLGTRIFGGNFYNNLDGIAMLRADWTEIHGTDVYSNRQDGIVIAASEGVAVIGGTVRLNGSTGTASYRNGIRIDDTGVSPPSARTRIEGVVVKTNSEYGIVERGSADYDLIIGCIIDNNGSGPISSVGTNTKIAHNMGISTHNA